MVLDDEVDWAELVTAGHCVLAPTKLMVLGKPSKGLAQEQRTECMYTRRMPRMQVYLPDDLYRALKERDLPASELLQDAVRAELRRQQLIEETDRYLTELVDEVGEPSARALARAEALSRRIRRR